MSWIAKNCIDKHTPLKRTNLRRAFKFANFCFGFAPRGSSTSFIHAKKKFHLRSNCCHFIEYVRLRAASFYVPVQKKERAHFICACVCNLQKGQKSSSQSYHLCFCVFFYSNIPFTLFMLDAHASFYVFRLNLFWFLSAWLDIFMLFFSISFRFVYACLFILYFCFYFCTPRWIGNDTITWPTIRAVQNSFQ